MSYFTKDPNEVDNYQVIWCDIDNTNDGSTTDDGELQGATISTSSWSVPAGITNDADGKASITIKGVTYAVDTVANITLSGGTSGETYACVNTITTSDSRTLEKTIYIVVQDNV